MNGRMREIVRADRWAWPRIIWIEAGQWRYHWRAKLGLPPKHDEMMSS